MATADAARVENSLSPQGSQIGAALCGSAVVATGEKVAAPNGTVSDASPYEALESSKGTVTLAAPPCVRVRVGLD